MGWHVDIGGWLDKPRLIQVYSDDGQECDYLPERTCHTVPIKHDAMNSKGEKYIVTIDDRCSECGVWISVGANYCPGCGARVRSEDETS